MEGDGIESRLPFKIFSTLTAIQHPYIISTYIKNTVFSPFSDLLDGGHRGPIEVAVVLSGLNELVVLNVSLHGLSRFNKVVVATIDLKLTARSRRMWNTGPEAIGVF